MSSAPELESYFAESAAWAADRERLLRSSCRTAWRVAAAGSLCTVTTAVALMLMMPLKSVEPFVIRVDNTTGVVDVVPVAAGRTALPEAVTRYFLTHYLTVCERFNYSTAESDYEECAAFQGPQRNQAWYALWARSNPASPLNVYKDGSSVRAQVTAVTFFKRASGLTDLAQVRYLKVQRAGLGGAEISTHWVATIQYALTEPARDPRIRRWNPLGFKVLDFQSEPEARVESEHEDTSHES